MAIININPVNFKALVAESDQTVLVKYFAPWCGYCQRIEPVFEELSSEYEDVLKFGQVNTDEQTALSDQEEIEVIPTFVLYRNGKAIASIVSPDNKDMLKKFLEEHLH